MKAVLKYPGAKHNLSSWITSFFPEHKAYLEPFCGSAAVFFQKIPAPLETLNDIDGEIVNLFEVIRSAPKELARQIYFTPWSREELYKSYNANIPDLENIERARIYLARSWQSIGNGQRHKNGFKHSVAPNGPVCAKAWAYLPDTILQAAERLKNAQIENSDAIELIRKFNDKETLIYIDPPYPLSTRKNYLYRHEMTDADHVRLLDAVIDSKSMIVLSGYDCELYNDRLAGWQRYSKKQNVEAAQTRTETLWMNFRPEMTIDELEMMT